MKNSKPPERCAKGLRAFGRAFSVTGRLALEGNMRKPRVIVRSVAGHYARDGERIIEVSFEGGAGALISLQHFPERTSGDRQRPRIEVYRTDGQVQVIVPEDETARQANIDAGALDLENDDEDMVRQTACKYCGLDIENMRPEPGKAFPRGEWTDRGGNCSCNDGKHKHAPVNGGR